MLIDGKKKTNKKKRHNTVDFEVKKKKNETNFAVARTVKWHLVGPRCEYFMR